MKVTLRSYSASNANNIVKFEHIHTHSNTNVRAVRPGPTWRYVVYLLVFDDHNVTLMWCPKNKLQWQWRRLCINLWLLNVWNGCRVGPGQTGRTFLFVFLRVRSDFTVLLIGVWCITRSWFHLHVLFCCPNILQWRYRPCVDLRLLNVWNVVVMASDEQHVRLYCCVRVLLLVFGALWGDRNLNRDVQICYNNADDGSRLCIDLRSLNVWDWCRLGPGRIGCTFIFLEFDTFMHWCSMIITLLSCDVQKINFNGNDDGSALIFGYWMYGTDAVLAPDKQAVRFYLYFCVCARILRCYWLVFDALRGRDFIFMCYFVVQIYYNGDTDPALIFVCWMYETGAMLVLDEQTVCILLRVRARTWRCYWRSMQCKLVISPSSCRV